MCPSSGQRWWWGLYGNGRPATNLPGARALPFPLDGRKHGPKRKFIWRRQNKKGREKQKGKNTGKEKEGPKRPLHALPRVRIWQVDALSQSPSETLVETYDCFAGCACPRCPEQWMAYRESCYSFSKEEKDWNSSQESCRAQGAHLLVISDPSEMTLQTELYWIGLKNSTGGDWVWEDGSKLSDKKVPSNSPVQNCAVLLQGAIHASSCEFLAPWVCEKSLQ
uniref:C-type lectin domain-containing protein n=1 Tax=Buteo japonicus TaxID=224669 RepID=A0A8C0BVI3_9AVES